MWRYVAVLAMCCGMTAWAQEPDAPPPGATQTLSVKVQVVAVNALVHDREGNLVRTLGKQDFHLRVDNKPVDVKYFNRDSDLPLTIGLLIDTSGSQLEFYDEEARASEVFLRDMMTQPTDRALVVRFDSNVFLLQGLTSRLPELHNGLRRMDYHRDPNLKNGHGGTLLYEAISQVCHNVIGDVPGRRALVILTDGGDNGSRASLDDAIRFAQQADVAVYSILYTNEDPNYPKVSVGRPSGIDVMRQISQATGGREFIVGHGLRITDIYAAVAQDLRSQYRLGFTPPPGKPGKYHSIKLDGPEKDFTVQARAGFYTPN